MSKLRNAGDDIALLAKNALQSLERNVVSAGVMMRTAPQLDYQQFATIMESIVGPLPGNAGASLSEYVLDEERAPLEAEISARPGVNRTEFHSIEGGPVPELDSYIVHTMDWPVGSVSAIVSDYSVIPAVTERLRPVWRGIMFNTSTSTIVTTRPFPLIWGYFGYSVGVIVTGCCQRPSFFSMGFAVEPMLAAIVPRFHETATDVRVFDVSEDVGTVLLYSSDSAWDTPRGQAGAGRRFIGERLRFADRQLLMEVRSTTPLDELIPSRAMPVWIIGCLVTMVAVVLLLMSVFLSELSRKDDLLKTEKEATERANQEMLSYLFHEIRNPLHVLQSLAGTLSSDPTLDKTGRRLFRESVTHIAHLVEDFSPNDVTRTSTLKPRVTPLLPLVRDLLFKHRSAVRGRGQCVLESSPGLAEKGWVDRTLLKRTVEESLLWTLYRAGHGDVSVRLSRVSIDGYGSGVDSIVTNGQGSAPVPVSSDTALASIQAPRVRATTGAMPHALNSAGRGVSLANARSRKEVHYIVDMEDAGCALRPHGCDDDTETQPQRPLDIPALNAIPEPPLAPSPDFQKPLLDEADREALLIEIENSGTDRERSLEELAKQLPSPGPHVWNALSSTWRTRDLRRYHTYTDVIHDSGPVDSPRLARSHGVSTMETQRDLSSSLPVESIRKLGGCAGLKEELSGDGGVVRLWICLPMHLLSQDPFPQEGDGDIGAYESYSLSPPRRVSDACGNNDWSNAESPSVPRGGTSSLELEPARTDTHPPSSHPGCDDARATSCSVGTAMQGKYDKQGDAAQQTDDESPWVDQRPYPSPPGISSAGDTTSVDSPRQGRPRRRRRRRQNQSKRGKGPDPEHTNGDRDESPSWKGTVVVVDDERANLLVTSRMLQQLRYRSVTLEDGIDLAQELSRLRMEDGIEPIAVLLDIVMLHSNGVQVCRELRKDGDRAALIAATGSVTRADLELYESVGFDGVLPKPYSVADISACLKKVGGVTGTSS